MAKNNPNQTQQDNQAEKAERRAEKQARRAAKRNAQMQYNPAFNELDRQMEQAQMQFQNQSLGGQSIFGGAGEILEGLPKQYQNMAAGYPDQYQQSVEGMSALVNPGGMPSGEVGAATDMYNTSAANHLANFSSNAQRMQGHNESAQRENQLSNRYYQLNLQDAMQDKITQYENQRQRLMENMGLAQKAELDSIREEAAFQQLLQDLIGNYGNTGNTGPSGRDRDGGVGEDRYTPDYGYGDTYHPGYDTSGDFYNPDMVGDPRWDKKTAQLQKLVNRSEGFSDLPSWLDELWSNQISLADIKKPRRKYIAENLTPPSWLVQGAVGNAPYVPSPASWNPLFPNGWW